MSAPLEHRLFLVGYVTKRLENHRRDDLVPECGSEWGPGDKRTVKFGGRVAGKVSLPADSVFITVDDPDALLAWAEKHVPQHVEDHRAVVVDDDLLDYLEERRPQSVRTSRRCDPQWVADLTASLKDPGHFVTKQGEKLTEVPGVSKTTRPGAPRVELADDADDVIAQARREGLLDFPSMLALPAGGEDR